MVGGGVRERRGRHAFGDDAVRTEREDTAHKIARQVLAALLKVTPLIALALFLVTPAHAMQPPADVGNGAMGAKQPCDAVARLAFVAETEAFTQPVRAQVAIMQIVAREAAMRNMSICALTERTNFVSVWHYAQARPESWTARQLGHPQTWALELGADVLAGRVPDETGNAGHFDGNWTAPDCAFVIGQTCFRP